MNLTTLKKQKTFNAIRINENYIANDDIINKTRNYLIKQGNEIISEKQNFNYDFIYCNTNKIENLNIYYKNCSINEIIESLKKQNKKINIISFKIQGDYLFITASGINYIFGVMTNKSNLKKKQRGKITFRASGDYIFHYTDSENKEHKIYGEKIKASQINNNILTVKDFRGNEYKYILEI